ncbi:MAG: beta-propeller domain-containing protein [Bacteriovoracaceae bacterium]|nr:beta-propeller domain-containing protein [Bacteriovoracaceae bacterium]
MQWLTLIMLILSGTLSAQVLNPDLPATEKLTQAYLTEMSERKIGQSEFIVADKSYMDARAAMRDGAPGAAGGADREIQESDVYKLGKTDQKELFLLNKYRGFQVVSFAQGLESPSLVGRYPVYNNWNSEMYYLEKQDRVVVINTEWNSGHGYDNGNYITMFYILDVSDSKSPKLINKRAINGYLQESRFVGDVLYAITSNGNWSRQEMEITSLKLEGNELNYVDTQNIGGNNRWVRTMNVLKYQDKYYVISTMTDWRQGQDQVDLFDITSAKGDVVKVQTVQARGQILERSQTFIHKDHLFVVSNYLPDAKSKMRISVEAFPVAKSDKVLVSTETMRISVGDTNGQHASLQDTRVADELLYTFWVPANNIDPFDLFDISNPAAGIKHLGQLQFEGWIAKAFPITYKNEKYVLGLGWVLPVTNENEIRYPQAKLFKIKNKAGVYSHEVVASLTLDSERVWSSLNAKDKFFEMIREDEANLKILFPVTFMDDWSDGAKILSVNLAKGEITEAAKVRAEQEWLKRIFLNNEVSAINTFSYENLATYAQSDLGNKGFAKTISTLELARNIIDTFAVSNESAVQVIEKADAVEFRWVSLNNTDAEILQVIRKINVAGQYNWHAVKGNRLYVINSHFKAAEETSRYSRYNQDFDKATFTVIDLDNKSVVSTKDIELALDADSRYYRAEVDSYEATDAYLLKIAGHYFSLENDELKAATIEESCQYFFQEDEDYRTETSVEVVNGQLLAYRAFHLPFENEDETDYYMPFMRKLSVEQGSIKCSASINVPGMAATYGGAYIMAKAHQTGYGYGPRPFYYDYMGMSRGGVRRGYYGREESATYSLKLEEQKATLMDYLDSDITNNPFAGGFLSYNDDEKRLDLWNLSSVGEFYTRPLFLKKMYESNSLITTEEVQNRYFIFMQNDKKVDVYELVDEKRIKQLSLTSNFDTDVEDKSAEYIFDIQSIRTTESLDRFIISQGLYGVTEIKLK